jgi:hypothetical protein
MITSGGKRKPTKPDLGADIRVGRRRINPACPLATIADATVPHGVHGHEIHGQDGLGLRGEKLAPGRTRPAICGIDADVMQDLSHGQGGDAMAEPDQLAA